MNAAIYLRVSTEKQDANVQLPALYKLCEGRGWAAPPVFQETESGAKPRPTLDKLCERARRGEYQVVVVWALDRLGRDLWETIARVRGLWAAGVKIASVQDAWIDGADGPVRDLLLMVLSWVAQFERQRLRERTRAGVANARAKGKRLGRPRAKVDAAVKEYRETKAAQPFASERALVATVAERHGVSTSTLRRALKA
jgi:putative DNA-invertase from lambdoid prophage Rac